MKGEDAFALHDTYGFPIELTEEIAHEAGGAVDREGFERAMDEQRDRARAASKFARGPGEDAAAWTEVSEGPDSEFLGYVTLAAEGLRLRRWRRSGEDLELVLDRTPCYAESGGQVADRGTLEGGGARATLAHVYKEHDAIVHRVRLASGAPEALLAAGAAGQLRATVDPAHRRPTLRHHTATHLLHAALRRTLGEHVRQAGSLVAPDRLRFDYHHFEAPTREQLAAVEAIVNEWVLRNRPVTWQVMPIAAARAQGAMALFGEKYGAEVRMVTVDGVEDDSIAPSRELCGGTHVERTGDIGAFVVVSEGAIAAGVRRIEALCGAETLRWAREEHETLARAAAALQVTPAALPEQIERLRGELAALRKAASDARRGGLEAEMERIARSAVAGPRGRWAVAAIDSDADANAVRDAADRMRGVLGSGAVVMGLRAGGKLTFVAAVTDDLVASKTLNASDLVKQVAKLAGGAGGGKPHLALAGAKEPEKMEAALDEARRLLQTALGA